MSIRECTRLSSHKGIRYTGALSLSSLLSASVVLGATSISAMITLVAILEQV